MARGMGVLACTALLLAGCGGSDAPAASAVPDPGPQGFYAGNFVSETSGFTLRAYALIADDGEVRFVEPALGRQLILAFPAAGSDWHATLAGYAGPVVDFPDGSGLCTGRVDGSAFAAAELIGSYTCGGDQGRFDLGYDDQVSFNPQDVSLLTGVVEQDSVTGNVTLLNIAPDGSFSGFDSAGCSYSGSFSVADPIVDIYAMQLRRDCAGQATLFSGSAALAPARGVPALYYGVSGMGQSLAGLLVFQ